VKKRKDKLSNICPFTSCYSYVDGSSVNFLLPDKRITLKNLDPKFLLKLCKQCNGFNTVKQIVKNIACTSNHRESDVIYVIKKLLENDILVDIHCYYLLFHSVSANPMPYVRTLSNKELLDMFRDKSSLLSPVFLPSTYLERLMDRRVSERGFINSPITENELLRLLWSTYGKIDRSKNYPENKIGLGTVPSGGALYPLLLRVVLFKKIGSYKKGAYVVLGGKIKYLKSISAGEIRSSFFGKHPFLDNASLCIAICGNFNQTTKKYSNRGYRYALLEAGHAAQNAYLWCSENSLGVVEVCGFKDEEFSRLLDLDYPHEAVLTTLFVGKK